MIQSCFPLGAILCPVVALMELNHAANVGWRLGFAFGVGCGA
jgi:hypothetical protein